MHLTPDKFRAARELAGIRKSVFPKLALISRKTISDYENEKSDISNKTQEKILKFFRNRNIRITENGVYKDTSTTRILSGDDGFRQLYEDYYHTIKDGGSLRLYNGYSGDVMAALGSDYVDMHISRMIAIKDTINVRAIVQEGDWFSFGKKYAEYRWLAPEHFKEGTLFIYGEKFAYVRFCGELRVNLTHDPGMTEMLELFFDQAWENLAKEIPRERST